MGYGVGVYISYGRRALSCSGFLDVLSQNRLEILGKLVSAHFK